MHFSNTTHHTTTPLARWSTEPSDPEKPDEPDPAPKSDQLVEEPETEVVKNVVNDTPYVSAKSFEDLGLSEGLLKGLYSEMKFERPSKIQGETLPMILTPPYRNLIAQVSVNPEL